MLRKTSIEVSSEKLKEFQRRIYNEVDSSMEDTELHFILLPVVWRDGIYRKILLYVV